MNNTEDEYLKALQEVASAIQGVNLNVFDNHLPDLSSLNNSFEGEDFQSIVEALIWVIGKIGSSEDSINTLLENNSDIREILGKVLESENTVLTLDNGGLPFSENQPKVGLTDGFVKVAEGPLYKNVTEIGELPSKGTSLMLVLNGVYSDSHNTNARISLQVSDGSVNEEGERIYLNSLSDYHNGMQSCSAFLGGVLTQIRTDMMFRLDDFRQVWKCNVVADSRNPFDRNSKLVQELLGTRKSIKYVRVLSEAWSPISGGEWELYVA